MNLTSEQDSTSSIQAVRPDEFYKPCRYCGRKHKFIKEVCPTLANVAITVTRKGNSQSSARYHTSVVEAGKVMLGTVGNIPCTIHANPREKQLCWNEISQDTCPFSRYRNHSQYKWLKPQNRLWVYITQYCASALVSLMDWEHFWENTLSKKISCSAYYINPHVGYYLVVLRSVVKAELDTSSVQY